jgi:hypothetical protein
MSEQEMLVLGPRDRDRLKALREVEQRHLREQEAAKALRMADRWAWQLLFLFTHFPAP